MASKERFVPVFFEVIRNYSLALFKKDLFAGITVGIVAVPLALAFAIASGATPSQGIFTAVIAGFFISFLGGSRYQIGGPTGAFVIIIYGIIAQHGYDGLIIATIMAGIILICLGIARVGSFIKFIPYPVTTGFTAGIGVVIFSSQIKDFLGLTYKETSPEFIDKWISIFSNLSTINISSAAIGAGTVIIILIIRKMSTNIPSHVVAIVISTAACFLLGLNAETIGDRFGTINAVFPSFTVPEVTIEKIRALFPAAITIALLAGIESLLSAVVADGMTGSHHKSNTELIGQGAANILSGFFGCIPATGAIARTATNVRAGGVTPLSGITHAVFLCLFILFFSFLIEIIPMAALAGVLLVVSVDMMGIKNMANLLSSPKSDVVVLLTTFILTIVIDLTAAVQVGVVLAALLFMKRMSDVTSMGKINFDVSEKTAKNIADPDATSNKEIPEGVEVYEINGPFFFGVADMLINTLEHIGKTPKVFILRMRNVPAIDATGEHALENFYNTCKKAGTQLVLSGVNPAPYATLKKMHFIEMIGEENITNHIDKALIRTREILKELE
ncbi:SulP family inorganic anion transporter [Mucispirillum schaedleri]|jgi:SulP family sulfate permease|uniref:C4-dicarboxylic acid transporter DauA n=1 Tax=Mucispirillum schaedleri ASF457 TaxID=1379858 RepID=V2QDT7_9BACT|nr:sulfate permease [Mucispirillum schaedleri]MCX4360464.1 sulfate permease [Mucispirillum schaedleri]USF23898.1 C4-dicarboxylic acid transporter DauA [Mucispirillum schaedleri ASF457]SIW06879.1 putative sulfate transporter YvdB [Mucispirillum schaedleri ASF457]